jgi:hypothetical protein
MESSHDEVNLRGKAIKVAAIRIQDRAIVVTGKWLRTAAVKDEEWLEGEVVTDPELFITKLVAQRLRADIFTFAQRIPNTAVRYKYHFERDNVAAIRLTSFPDWWEKCVPQETRKNVRRAERKGVVTKVVAFDDALVRGIVGINNDTPERQGHRFWHYGKDFNTVMREYATFSDRSEFIGAYHGDELIGVIKIVYLRKVASILQILSKVSHFDKRPTNALLAKAVEVCAQKGMSHLVYGKYTYGNKKADALTEFKRRNGFEKMEVPRYYIPLTFRGNIAVRFRLQLGLIGILPGDVLAILLKTRASFFRNVWLPLESVLRPETQVNGSRRSAAQDERAETS